MKTTKVVKSFTVIGLLAVMLLTFSAISLNVQAQEFTVGAMVWDTTVPFYTNFLKGLKDAADEYDVEVLIRNGQGELNQEISVIKQFISQEVDLIVVTPSDAEGIVPVIKQANKAGIPVIAANNNVGEGADVLTYVGADDYRFGWQQGKMVEQAVGESGKIAYIMGHLGTSPQIKRKNGLQDYLNENTEIEIVSSVSASWKYSKALAATQDFLSKYQEGELDAVVSQGPEGVAGARYAAENGRKEIDFITGDYPADVRKAIQEGKVYGTVNQDPYPQGYLAVEYAYKWLSGKKNYLVTPNAYLYLPLITSENVDDYPPAWGGE